MGSPSAKPLLVFRVLDAICFLQIFHFLRKEVLVIDPRNKDGQPKGGKEDDANNTWWDVHKLAQNQLDANEDKNSSNAILEELEELDELVNNEEHCTKTKHRKDSRGVRQKQIWNLGNDCTDRIHCKKDVTHFKADYHQEQHSRSCLRPHARVILPDSSKVNSSIAALLALL